VEDSTKFTTGKFVGITVEATSFNAVTTWNHISDRIIANINDHTSTFLSTQVNIHWFVDDALKTKALWCVTQVTY
jgi:hypothetical protein